MKYVAIFMALLVVAAGVLGIYTYANTRLAVVSVSVEMVSAAQRESEFLSWQSAMDHDAVAGTPFTDELPGSADDYSFFTYTFRLKNGGLIDAEMVEIQPVPVNGDVLAYSTTDAAAVNANNVIPAGSERNLWSVVLTSARNQSALATARSFKITYYIWGIPWSITAACK